MRPTLTIAVLGLFIACDAPTVPSHGGAAAPDDAPPSDTQPTDAPPATAQGCEAEVSWVTPRDDRRHVPTHGDIKVGFSESVAGLDWSVDVRGIQGHTTLSADGRVATFTPSTPTAPHTIVEVHAAACGSHTTSRFETIGPEVSLEDISGRSWAIQTSDLTWLSPANAGLVTALAWPTSLVLTLSDGPEVPEPHIATPQLGACDARAPLGVIDLSDNPRVTTTPAPLSITFGGAQVTLHEFTITGVVEGAGEWVADIELNALLDARALPATPSMSLCDIAELRGEPCAPCPDGVDACVPIFATAPVAHDLSSDAGANTPLGCLPD